ncbi:MAG: hypothetical protein ACYCUI_15405 [Vulcanimicrobiaceae bacterium]
MDRIEIDTWANISAESWNSLLLGNGASIAIHKEFAYPTLHSVADAKGLLVEYKTDSTDAPQFSRIDDEGGGLFQHRAVARVGPRSGWVSLEARRTSVVLLFLLVCAGPAECAALPARTRTHQALHEQAGTQGNQRNDQHGDEDDQIHFHAWTRGLDACAASGTLHRAIFSRRRSRGAATVCFIR